jgi:hypothetical protein
MFARRFAAWLMRLLGKGGAGVFVVLLLLLGASGGVLGIVFMSILLALVGIGLICIGLFILRGIEREQRLQNRLWRYG